MSTENFYNDITKKWIDAYIARPKATLIINSSNDTKAGVEIAEKIYKNLVSDSKIPLFRLELQDKKSIGIDEVRELQRYLSLRANDSHGYSRFVIIPEAEKLTPEAQNALLKLLEELPSKTIVMLVVSIADKMLTTITSRCFTINVLPITSQQAWEYAARNKIDLSIAKKAFIISEGHITTFMELVNENDNSIYEMLQLSKDFFKATIFERQILLQNIYIKEVAVDEFINTLKLTARTGMRNTKTSSAKQHWKDILVSIISTEEQIRSNVQTKLALLSLSVSI
jgi:hypothetical protein